MNVEQVREPDAKDEEQQRIVEYLQQHPKFLISHPALLAGMQVTHECGGAVSLIEHQVDVLRDQNRHLRHKLQALIANARANEELSQRAHRLTMDLMACAALDQVLTLLYAALQDDFSAEILSLRLYATPRNEQDLGLAEFRPYSDTAADILDDIQRVGHPLCGRLKAIYRNYLFADQAANVQSGVMITLGGVAPFGILALGSEDAKRYHPGMGTMFLRQLADIAESSIRPFIKNG